MPLNFNEEKALLNCSGDLIGSIGLAILLKSIINIFDV
tara:strand:- start:349 stop:462 length:114 start_codon:yes stop_codon:yes gene_type:complete